MAASSEVEEGSREQQLLAFCATEMSGFFGYLSAAIAGFGQGGELPASKFKAKARAAAKEAKAG